jgi:hypothetical protein
MEEAGPDGARSTAMGVQALHLSALQGAGDAGRCA